MSTDTRNIVIAIVIAAISYLVLQQNPLDFLYMNHNGERVVCPIRLTIAATVIGLVAFYLLRTFWQ